MIEKLTPTGGFTTTETFKMILVIPSTVALVPAAAQTLHCVVV